MTNGWHRLTKIERAVLELACEGLSNREIGERMHLSPRTAQRHLYEIFRKVAVKSRTQLAVEAIRRGEVTTGADESGRTTADGSQS